MRLYSYVVRWDHGFAPNPFHGVCSLATCKPGIRKGAKLGDWVLGTGSAEVDYDGRAIFLMRVTADTTFEKYWDEPHYEAKKPVLNGSYKRRFGDNIYHRGADGKWIQEDSRHSGIGAKADLINLKRDTGTTNRVLLSTDFIYWGEKAPMLPKSLAHFHIAQPSYRYNFADADVAKLLAWAQRLGVSGQVGVPVEWQWADKW